MELVNQKKKRKFDKNIEFSKMLRYNTQLKRLPLPEYGRNIQEMIDYCLTIEDREERTVCAYSIVASMANLFPELKTGGEYNHKLWDHLAIMSDFNLDIDYPCEIIRQDNLNSRPERLSYNDGHLLRRQYGRTIQSMVSKAAQMEESDDRKEFIRLLANQMKKQLMTTNRDGVDDQRVFRDLYEMSSGAIRINPNEMTLNDYFIPVVATGKKKKKK